MQRLRGPIAIIHFINTYSILVAVGSYSCFIFFSRAFAVESNYWVALGLALGVWFIYTLDHLIDGIQLKDRAKSLRHKVHYDYKLRLIYLLILVGMFLIMLAFKIPEIYFQLIALLLGLTALHFIVNYVVSTRIKRRIFLKEIFIALVVAIGFCITPIVPLGMAGVSPQLLIHFGCIFCINVANLFLFSMYDKEVDSLSDVLSVAQLTSTRNLKIIAGIAIIGSALLSLIGFYRYDTSVFITLTFVVMQSTLLFILRHQKYFAKEDRYRFFGDLIYVYPLAVTPFL
ncbi:MAG: hypothetical protein ABF321_11140 [Bacteroidia bacterium]